MKTVLAILFTVFISDSAHAISYATVAYAMKSSVSQGRQFEVKRALNENQEVVDEVTGGTMTIGETSIKIQLYGQQLCSSPSAELPKPQCFTPPILDVVIDIDILDKTGCGDMYTAEENKMPADGLYTFLEVADYSSVQCKKFFPNAAEATLTVRHYDRFAAEIVSRTYILEFAQSLN